MRGFLVNELSHPSTTPLSDDIPEPIPGKDEVLVDIFSAGLNFFDILQAQGKYQDKPSLPFILGHEFAGKISADSPIPLECSFKRGDRVFGQGQGAFAESLKIGWKNLLPLPDTLSFDEGAGLCVTLPTSYEALVGRAELKAGEWVLVTAAAGGVGIVAVQIAKALGAKVIAAASSPAKLAVAKLSGADHCVDYTKATWQKEILKITGGKGVDVIYDPVGRINESLKCIAWKGRALVIGFAGGTIEKVPMNIILLKNVSLVGLHWGAYLVKEPNRIPKVWKDLLSLLSSGQIKPVIYDTIYPLDNILDGLTALERRETWGKTIVRIRNDIKERSKL